MWTEELFGGRVRAGALETLARTPLPLSAYRVAKTIGAESTQVLCTLRGLEPEVVRRTERGWVLVNDHLRRLLREELERREAARREEKDELLKKLGLKPRAGYGRA